ncbi:hypothetical protein YERSI8AC_260014 [Enterobacterales bacterium 8AC]|nr:hypothetical protein YERSI8AC_260014 [Enterobacterales bacterium 8AC]
MGRIRSIICWVIAITILTAIVLWFCNLFTLPSLGQTTNWSNFGAFIGGVAGPLLSLLSILFVLDTIKLTQRNHNEQIALIRKEQLYTKFTDLCNYLKLSLKESWLDIENPHFKKVMHDIKNDANEDISKRGITDLASKMCVCMESAQSILSTEKRSIERTVIILSSLSKFILKYTNDEKELMINIIGLTISKEQRFVIFMLMRCSEFYRPDTSLLNENSPYFWVEPWIMDFLHDGEPVSW